MNFNLCSLRKLHAYFVKMGYILLLAGLPACNLPADPIVEQIQSYIMTNIAGNDQSVEEMVRQCGLQADDIKELTEQLVKDGVLNAIDKKTIEGEKCDTSSCTKQLQQLFRILNTRGEFDRAWQVILINQQAASLIQAIMAKANEIPSTPPLYQHQECLPPGWSEMASILSSHSTQQMTDSAPMANSPDIRAQLNQPAIEFLTNRQEFEPDWPMIGTAFYAVRQNHEELVTLLKKNNHEDRIEYLAEILKSASPNYLAADILLKLHGLFEYREYSRYQKAVGHVVFRILNIRGITNFQPFRQHYAGTYFSPNEYCRMSGIAAFFVKHARKFEGEIFSQFAEISVKLQAVTVFPFYEASTLEKAIEHLYRHGESLKICTLLSWLSQAAYGETGMRPVKPFLTGITDDSELKKKITSVLTMYGTEAEQRYILLYTNGLIAPGINR